MTFSEPDISRYILAENLNTMSKSSAEETAMQKQAMIRALEANYGNITKAAKAAGIAASTHFRWMKEDSEYEEQADAGKDVGYRNIKDSIIDMAMNKAKKGNVAVLNKLMGVFLKNLPEEMKILHRANNVPLRARIKYIDKPPGWDEAMGRLGDNVDIQSEEMPL